MTTTTVTRDCIHCGIPVEVSADDAAAGLYDHGVFCDNCSDVAAGLTVVEGTRPTSDTPRSAWTASSPAEWIDAVQRAARISAEADAQATRDDWLLRNTIRRAANAGITQDQIADATGLSQQRISQIVRGVRR